MDLHTRTGSSRSSNFPKADEDRPSDVNAYREDVRLCAKKAALVIQEVALANSKTLVDRGILEEIVVDNKERFAGCVTMPLTFLFLTLYIFAAVLHEDITNVHLAETPLRESFMPALGGILTTADVWDYVRHTVIPVFFRQKNMYNESIANSEDWSRVFTYNQLKGPMAFQQTRSVSEPCGKFAEHMVCYPMGKYSAEPFGLSISDLVGVNMSVVANPAEGFEIEATRRLEEDPAEEGFINRRLRVTREELARYMPKATTDDSLLFKWYLYPNTPAQEIEQRLDYYGKRIWLDDSTARVNLEALVLNSEFEPARMSKVSWRFAFSRGGGVFATMRFEPMFLRAWSSSASVVVDILFVLMLVVQSAVTVVSTFQARRGRMCKAYFMNMVNVMAWASILVSWMNVMGFFMQNTLRKQVVQQIEAYDGLSSNTSSIERQESAMGLHKAADDMTAFSMWYRLLITYMNLLLMLRCFLVLEFQPRLAVVVATLKATSIDLAHFLIVFVPTFLAYAIAGMCIFGRRVEEFSSVERSIGTCFKMAIESEYMWNKLSEEDWLTSASWVWTFLLLIVLLMLNMVLAIIMDVYTEVRNAAGDSETVVQNISFLIKRVWLRREWISDDKLLEVLGEMPRAMTGKEFREAFPGMTDVQFQRLISTAVAKAQVATRTGLHNSFLTHMTSAMKLGLSRASRLLATIREDQQRLKVTEKCRPDPVCVEDIMQSVAVQNHWMSTVRKQLHDLREQMRSKEHVF